MTEPTRPQRVAQDTVDALHRGDRHAFEELYMQLHSNVYNLAARIVGDRGEAEDITQEVFLRAYRHLPGENGPLRPEAWVFRATVNACYDHLRRRRPEPVELIESRAGATGDAFEQSATAAAVEKALAAINPRYRTALILKDLHGLGNGEIADIMGVGRGTVGVLLFRARGAFEKRYREVAPTVGAGIPVAGLALWLPTLPVPASLQTPPAFLAPVAAPIATAPVAPAASWAAPLTAGLAKVGGALATKVAVVAIAATAVTGGGIAVHEAREADRPAKTDAVTVPAPADAAAYDDWRPHALTHGAAHGDLTGGFGSQSGGGGAGLTSQSGARAGTSTGGDAGAGGAATGSGTQTRSGDGAAGTTTSGTGGGSGTGTGTSSGGSGTGQGDGAGSGSGQGDGAGSGSGGTGEAPSGNGTTTTGGSTPGTATSGGSGGGATD